MEMFVRQGIRAVRMDDIARQLGVSKRTLYELFGDKEGLLYLAMDRFCELNRSRQIEASAGARNVLEALFRVLNGVMDHAESVQRVLEGLRKFYPAVYERMMHEGAAKVRCCLRDMLERGIDEGLFVGTFHRDLAISMLYHSASALTLRRDLILPEGMSGNEAFVQIVSNFFRGISTAEGMRLIDEYLRERGAAGGKSGRAAQRGPRSPKTRPAACGARDASPRRERPAARRGEKKTRICNGITDE